jgi:hypothetical protein
MTTESNGDAMGPDSPARPLAGEALARRKRRDVALILPLAGVFLLVSPFLDVFARAGSLLGVPVGVLYVFAVWLGLILAAAALARRLLADGEDG